MHTLGLIQVGEKLINALERAHALTRPSASNSLLELIIGKTAKRRFHLVVDSVLDERAQNSAL
ncbi:MAG: hypothetical protein AAF471_04955 [Myxococcota bacterium]